MRVGDRGQRPAKACSRSEVAWMLLDGALVGVLHLGRVGAWVDLEVLLEDPERGGSGRDAAVAPVFDQGADDELRARIGPVPAPPGLVLQPRVARQADVLLRGPRLAGDLDGERSEDARRGPVALVGRLVEALLDD